MSTNRRSNSTEMTGGEKCRICGDRALGLNFQVMSCDSCRSFFRRIVTTGKIPQCPFNGNCEINLKSRRFCQGCRIQKCFREGMKHDNYKSLSSPKSVESIDPPKVKKLKQTSVMESSSNNHTLSSNSPSQKCTCKCTCGYYNSTVSLIAASPLIPPSPPEVVEENSTSSQLDNLSPNNMLTFNDLFYLNELISANLVLKEPLELTLQELDSTEISLKTVVRISDMAMRRIVSMAKLLSGFRSLQTQDQVALLKGSLSELLILRGAMVFDSHKGAWNHNIYSGSRFISLKVDVLKKTPVEEHYDVHKRFLNTFDEKFKQNENIMLILNGITLFDPNRSNIRDVNLVCKTQKVYIDLLERYLRTEFTPTDAFVAYQSLMTKLVELKEVNRSIQRVYNRFDQNELDPLLRELFSGKTLSTMPTVMMKRKDAREFVDRLKKIKKIIAFQNVHYSQFRELFKSTCKRKAQLEAAIAQKEQEIQEIEERKKKNEKRAAARKKIAAKKKAEAKEKAEAKRKAIELRNERRAERQRINRETLKRANAELAAERKAQDWKLKRDRSLSYSQPVSSHRHNVTVASSSISHADKLRSALKRQIMNTTQTQGANNDQPVVLGTFYRDGFSIGLPTSKSQSKRRNVVLHTNKLIANFRVEDGF